MGADVNLLNNYNKVTKYASEYEMQEQIDLFLKQQTFRKWNGWQYEELPKIVLREFRIPEVGRISDHTLLINDRRVVNLECKLNDIGCVIRQAKDHLQWCDYSIIIIPPDSTYIANEYKYDCMKHGIGLWYWFNGIGIYEFILPSYNRNKDKNLRAKVIERMKAPK